MTLISPNNVTAQRLRQIYKLAAEEDSEIADVFRQEDDIALTNDCLAEIVGELQKYSFQQTPVDQKGRAFETFISGDMREEFKEFMTPRPVVSAIVARATTDATRPNGFDIRAPFRLPYSAKRIRPQQALATIEF